MDVGFEDVRDRNLLPAGEVEVTVHVRAWIEHRGDACSIIAYQIGKLGYTFGLNGFKYECHEIAPVRMTLPCSLNAPALRCVCQYPVPKHCANSPQ
jgi:hypothetical protein